MCVRVRPTATAALEGGSCVAVPAADKIVLTGGKEPRTFTFDHVLAAACTQVRPPSPFSGGVSPNNQGGVDVADSLRVRSQEEVFSLVAKDVVDNCMEGYNGTIFA